QAIRTCPAVSAGGTTSCNIELFKLTDGDSGSSGDSSDPGAPDDPFTPGDTGASDGEQGQVNVPSQYTVTIISGCGAAGVIPLWR
ncbi:MAG: hypothetical protein IJC63_01340, partial [Myxococcaceae bacterium]|nr:hypothetical protein [Myxococcaceae bacterium]